MILDSIDAAEKYYAVHPRFKAAFEFLSSREGKLQPGKYVVDGNDLYVSVVNGSLKKQDDAALEAHDRYIDIQVVLSGRERHGWRRRETCKDIKTAYDTEKDILFYRDFPSSFVDVGEREFVVFFPGDAHAPMIGEGAVTKAIVKVRV